MNAPVRCGPTHHHACACQQARAEAIETAARAVIAAMYKRLYTERAPQKFGAPFGELAALRDALDSK